MISLILHSFYLKLSATNTQRYSNFKIFILFIVHCLCYNNNINKALAKGADIMFDWNGNGKHDAFDDFVTFGLIHHIIEDSKKNEQPPAQNNRRGIYRHYDHDKNKTDNRSEAVKCLWILFGMAIMIGGVALTVCFIENQLLFILALLVTVIVGFIVASQGNDD